MNEDIYINLLYKELTGEASEAEKVQLDQWIAESEDNRLTAESVRLAWQESGKATASPVVDIYEDYAALQERITSELEDTALENGGKLVGMYDEERQPYNIRPMLMVAASIAVVVVLGILFKNFLTNSPNVASVEVQTTDAIQEITLPDGSRVTLNKNSQLRYPEKFEGQTRGVYLNGEAFFDVVHKPDHKFMVTAGEEDFTVLGTSFNVKAFDGDGMSELFVKTGKVMFSVYDGDEHYYQVLTKGEAANHDRDNKKLEKDDSPSPNLLAWQTQQLVFNETLLEDVVHDIEALFGIYITVENESLEACRFTSTFNHPVAEKVLQTVADVLNAQIVKEDEQNYRISGGSCE